MGKGHDVRKASRVKIGHIWTHIIPTRQAAVELPQKYIETYQNQENPHLLPDPHQVITLFNFHWVASPLF